MCYESTVQCQVENAEQNLRHQLENFEFAKATYKCILWKSDYIRSEEMEELLKTLDLITNIQLSFSRYLSK